MRNSRRLKLWTGSRARSANSCLLRPYDLKSTRRIALCSRMCHPRGMYVLNALMMVSSHTPQGICRLCRRLRRTTLFRVQLPWLIYFVRATFRSCDCFPELAYDSENSSQGKSASECHSLHKYSTCKQDHHQRGAIERDGSVNHNSRM